MTVRWSSRVSTSKQLTRVSDVLPVARRHARTPNVGQPTNVQRINHDVKADRARTAGLGNFLRRGVSYFEKRRIGNDMRSLAVQMQSRSFGDPNITGFIVKIDYLPPSWLSDGAYVRVTINNPVDRRYAAAVTATLSPPTREQSEYLYVSISGVRPASLPSYVGYQSMDDFLKLAEALVRRL
jgi:hypothetical protein